MEVYEKSTRPLADFYRQRGLLVTIEAEGTPEEIYQRTLTALGSAGGVKQPTRCGPTRIDPVSGARLVSSRSSQGRKIARISTAISLVPAAGWTTRASGFRQPALPASRRARNVGILPRAV